MIRLWKNIFCDINKFKYLWFLILLYTIFILMANWYNTRIIKFFCIITDAGTIIFPMTFIASNLITEVYGYKFAKKAIWFGFLFNLIFLSYGLLIVNMDSPNFALDNEIFNKIIILLNVHNFHISMIYITAKFICKD